MKEGGGEGGGQHVRLCMLCGLFPFLSSFFFCGGGREGVVVDRVKWMVVAVVVVIVVVVVVVARCCCFILAFVCSFVRTFGEYRRLCLLQVWMRLTRTQAEERCPTDRPGLREGVTTTEGRCHRLGLKEDVTNRD